MNVIDEIKFWAHQIAEHMDYIIEVIKNVFSTKSISPRLIEHVENLKDNWEEVEKTPELLKQGDLLNKTFILQDNLIQEIKVDDNDDDYRNAWKDLLKHMQEELVYFNDAIIAGKWKIEEEIVFWAREHGENLQFIIFNLSGFPRHDKISSMIKNLAKISSEFFVLGEEIEKSKMSSPCATISENPVLRSLIGRFLTLKEMHIKKIRELKRMDLPLPKSARNKFNDMLNHELAEAKFAMARITTGIEYK